MQAVKVITNKVHWELNTGHWTQNFSYEFIKADIENLKIWKFNPVTQIST